ADANGVFHIGYDANGFNIEKHTTGGSTEDDSYTPDLRGRLASATVNGVTTTEKYDTSGTIIAETTGSTTTYSLPDANNPSGYTYTLEQSSAQAGAPTQTFILGPTGLLAQVDGSSSAVTYLLTDGRGSTRQLADSTGAVKSYYA